MKPSVGRDVHYVAFGSAGGLYPQACRTAKITQVLNDTTVGLAVFNPTGLFFNTEVERDEEDKAGGTWHTPERVD